MISNIGKVGGGVLIFLFTAYSIIWPPVDGASQTVKTTLDSVASTKAITKLDTITAKLKIKNETKMETLDSVTILLDSLKKVLKKKDD